MPFSVATRWPFASRAVATSNERAPALVRSGPYCCTANGSSVNVHSFTAPRTPCAAPILAMQICAAIATRRRAYFLAAAAAAVFAAAASGVEEARPAIRRRRALGEPGFGLVHVELQPGFIVLRQ